MSALTPSETQLVLIPSYNTGPKLAETVREALTIFQNDPLVHEPGTRYLYSSNGWNLISAAVEGASDGDFLAYMNKSVFEPLGLLDTVADHADAIIPHRTRFYNRTEDGLLVNAPYADLSNKWAGGGFLSTPSDLVRWGSALVAEEPFLKPKTISQRSCCVWNKSRMNWGCDSTGRQRIRFPCGATNR